MPKFQTKPVVIEAHQFTVDNNEGRLPDSTWAFILSIPNSRFVGETLEIPTLEGVMIASLGDWIIKGVQGEFYPCKPDIFEQTYQAVVD